jgi:hypothetical protein
MSGSFSAISDQINNVDKKIEDLRLDMQSAVILVTHKIKYWELIIVTYQSSIAYA